MTARVLIVENDAIARNELAEILRERGYVVEQASNGREALENLTRSPFPPAVILLDLLLPVMNGWEFRSAQRSDRKLEDIPVIVMSGDADVARHARRLDASGYLRKPFGLGSLFHALETSGARALE